MISAAPVAAPSMGADILFWVCAVFAVLGAIGMITFRKAVHSALSVAFTMVNLAVLYVAMSAPFLGMVQVIVYTGAVMMLFVFVMMIVGVDASDSLVETIRGQRWAALVLAVAFCALLIGAIVNGQQGAESVGLDAANSVDGGNVQGIAHLIFTRYIVAFEVTSALLITAALGAMMLTHRERHSPKVGQEIRSRLRFSSGVHPGNLPAAGSYSRHNAVDTPALLPDGTPVAESVPGSLMARGSERAVNITNEQETRIISEGDSVISDDQGVEQLRGGENE